MTYSSRFGNMQVTDKPWYKSEFNIRSNYVLVKSLSDLPTPVLGVITLADNCTYEFNGIINIGVNQLRLVVSNYLCGLDKSDDGILYTGTSDAITGINKSVSIQNMTLVTTGVGSCCFNLTGSGSNVEIAGCIFSCVCVGTITSFVNAVFRGNLITGSDNGITFAGNATNYIIVDNIYVNNNSPLVAIHFTTATIEDIIMARNMFDLGVGQTGIKVDVGVTVTATAQLQLNTFNLGTALDGINGNSTNWTIMYGDNTGIGGLQFVDVDLANTTDLSVGNPSGTYNEATSVRGYVLPIAQYDSYATVMEGRVIALMTNAVGTQVQIGLRNLSTGTNIVASLGVATEGTLVAVQSVYTAITPNQNYNAYYEKQAGSSTRYGIKIQLKIY